MAHRHGYAACIQPEKVRGQDDDRAACVQLGLDFFVALDAYKLVNPGFIAPPENPAFEHAAAKQGEMRFDQIFAVDRRKLGKTQVDIYFGNPAPAPAKAIKQRSQGLPEGGEDGDG